MGRIQCAVQRNEIGPAGIATGTLRPAAESGSGRLSRLAGAGLRRVDLRLTDDGEIYVIEVNANCYLERSSEFAMAAAAEGIEYTALINREFRMIRPDDGATIWLENGGTR